MSTPRDLVPVTGSERELVPGSKLIGPVDPGERFEVSLLLRSKADPGQLPQLAADVGGLEPANKRHVSREEFASLHGTVDVDIVAVEAFAHEHGLDVVDASPDRRTVVLSGTTAQMADAFGVELMRYQHPSGTYRGRTGPVNLPSALIGVVQAVFGLDDRPQAQPHFRIAATTGKAAGAVSYSPSQVATLYDFPTGAGGTGQTIGIIELGGGYRTSDLKAYFKGLGIAAPNVVAVSVDQGHNRPTGDPRGPDGEVMLDIEVAGAVAPGARVVVYFAPNTDRGFIDAVSTAIHDAVRKPSVVSISWGGPEANWTAQAMTAFDQALQAAAVMGVTVLAAAGDNGSTDGLSDGLAHVDFPASSPHIVACGGTRLQGTGTLITDETVWNDGPGGGATGGGVSDFFPLPAWQSKAGVPPSVNPGNKLGRGVPDVCADADPQSGYVIRVDGQSTVIGGTSAVAPLWAGLIALLNHQLGHPIGFVNPLLYQNVAGSNALHDITSGSNGSYSAGPGWDACTGFGSPDGKALAAALARTVVAAG